MKIGFIGLGNMGSAMAMNLLKAGHYLTVYNRTAQKARSLIDQGARAAADPAEASRAEVVFTMLADGHAVESVTFGESGVPGASPARVSPYFIEHDQRRSLAETRRPRTKNRTSCSLPLRFSDDRKPPQLAS